MKYIIKFMPIFIKKFYIKYKIKRLSDYEIDQFNRWYRNSEIKKNVDKRKINK